jgi:hypothetical protein
MKFATDICRKICKMQIYFRKKLNQTRGKSIDPNQNDRNHQNNHIAANSLQFLSTDQFR